MSVIMSTKKTRAYFILLLDTVMHIIAWVAGGAIRHGFYDFTNNFMSKQVYITTIVLAVILYTLLYTTGISDEQDVALQGSFYSLARIIRRQAIVFVFLMAYLFLTKQSYDISRIILVLFVVIDSLLEFLIRKVMTAVFRLYAKRGLGNDRLLVVTLKENASDIIDQFRNTLLKRVVGLVILDEDAQGSMINGCQVIGKRDNLLDTHKDYVYDQVFLHIPYDYDFPLEEIILGFEHMGIPVNLNVDVFGLKAEDKEIGTLGDYHVITFQDRSRKFFPQMIKRIMDILGSVIGIMLTIILTVFLAPAIKLTSKGPVFFSQIRVGMNGRRFKIYKFRSMVVDAEEQKELLCDQNEMDGYMFKIKDDPRITKVGRFIRRTSLDEFPQFYNVLKGEMSLVGTRPPTEDEYRQYENHHLRRLSIKPGITGLWQVSGRNMITNFEDVVKMDLNYIDQWSLLLDIKIILQTIAQLFGKSEGM